MNEKQIRAAVHEICNLWWMREIVTTKYQQDKMEDIIRKHAVGERPSPCTTLCEPEMDAHSEECIKGMKSVEQQNNFMGEVLKDI